METFLTMTLIKKSFLFKSICLSFLLTALDAAVDKTELLIRLFLELKLEY